VARAHTVSSVLPTAAGVDEPSSDCALCPRLADFIASQRPDNPDWHNGPVRSFGSRDARLLIVGLAPGLRGANRTGRPFTGDYAGDLLYDTLGRFGFASGTFAARPDDGLALIDCQITNAVRCVPPENKPLPVEVNTCRQFLSAKLKHMPRLDAVVVLGRVAHDATLGALGVRKVSYPFAHGARHVIERNGRPALDIFDSYHCSRYNTNTGVLTPEMFRAVFASVRAHLG
jgi:uracil-DNA glycosylase